MGPSDTNPRNSHREAGVYVVIVPSLSVIVTGAIKKKLSYISDEEFTTYGSHVTACKCDN
jgi:hypothetical protein